MKNLLEVGKKYFSVDAETDGLWGNPFAVAGIVYECVEGRRLKEIDRICLRLPNDVVTNDWVVENVLPTLDFEVTHNINRLMTTLTADTTKEKQLEKAYEEMLRDFASFYLRNKEAITIWHMGHIVETHLFREMHRIGAIGDWDAPYTPIEVSDFLRVVDQDCDSVDSYHKKYMPAVEGNTHNPLYDCRVTAEVFENICKNL